MQDSKAWRNIIKPHGTTNRTKVLHSVTQQQRLSLLKPCICMGPLRTGGPLLVTNDHYTGGPKVIYFQWGPKNNKLPQMAPQQLYVEMRSRDQKLLVGHGWILLLLWVQPAVAYGTEVAALPLGVLEWEGTCKDEMSRWQGIYLKRSVPVFITGVLRRVGDVG